MNEVYAEFFGETRPARTTVEVKFAFRDKSGNRLYRVQARYSVIPPSTESTCPVM